MLCENGFQFDRNLDDHRRAIVDWRNVRWLWEPCTGANRDVNYPISMADLLVMSQLRDNLTGRGATQKDWALRDKVSNYYVRLKIAVLLSRGW